MTFKIDKEFADYMQDLKFYKQRYKKLVNFLKMAGDFNKEVMLEVEDWRTLSATDNQKRKFIFNRVGINSDSNTIEAYDVKVLKNKNFTIHSIFDDKKRANVKAYGKIDNNSELTIYSDKKIIRFHFKDMEYKFIGYSNLNIDIDKLKELLDQDQSFENFYNLMKKLMDKSKNSYTNFAVMKNEKLIKDIYFIDGELSKYKLYDEKGTIREIIHIKDGKIIKELHSEEAFEKEIINEKVKSLFK